MWVAEHFEATTCCVSGCNLTFAFTSEFYKQRKKDRETFYCPNGHPQHFVGQSTEQKLRSQLRHTEREFESCMSNMQFQYRHLEAKRLAETEILWSREQSPEVVHIQSPHQEYELQMRFRCGYRAVPETLDEVKRVGEKQYVCGNCLQSLKAEIREKENELE
jgi:hypothetical protein